MNKIEKAKAYKDKTVKPKDEERLQRFRSDKKFYDKKFANLTQYSTTDTSVMSAVERMTAQIIKMVFGNSDIGSIKGRNADDDDNAQTMQELCNWQIEYANAGYQKFYWWIKECLYQLYSVVMVTQRREYEEVEEEKQVPYTAAEAFMEQCIANKVDITEVAEGSPGPDGMPVYNVKIKYTKLKHNYPLIENVPSEELIWTPGANTLADSELVGRRKQVTIDHLMRNIKKKQPDGTYTGMYDKAAVMSLIESSGDGASNDDGLYVTRTGEFDGDSYDIDDPNRKVTIVECFCKADINGDHMLEDCIITIVEDGNVVIRSEINEDGFPFCVASPTFDPYKVVPDISGIDALGQWQDLLTAIIKLTLQNLALNNNPQQLYNSAMFEDFNQILDGEQFIGVNGPPNEAMQPTAIIPLAPYTLQLIEMVKGWGEEASNVNRYNQGIDSGSLNKTATGITALINQGSEAMTLIMRNIAETGLKSLFMRMTYLNQKYIDHEQVVRLTNKDLTVNADNLKGDLDYVTDAGMGAGAKETDIANITQLIGLMPTLIQAGLADLQCAYNAQKKYLELIGIKSIDDYLIDPSKQQQAQPPQPQPVSESLRIDFNTLPINVKIQVLAKSGIQATPEDFMQQMQIDAQAKAEEARAKGQAEVEKTIVQAQVQDHHAARQHANNIESAQLNNQAKERQVVLNGQARAAAPGSDGAGVYRGDSQQYQIRPDQTAF